MLTTKTYPVVLLLVATLIIILSVGGTGGDDTFMEHLKSKLEKYNDDFNVERTYLMTDRFVYRPGEDLWFKGFVTSTNPDRKTFSEDFFIRLLDSRGEEIIYRRYPLQDHETSGRIGIPRSCIPGKYWLVAYTGWMKNRCPREAFRKEILISKYFEKRFRVEVLYDKLNYKTGDTLNAQIRILDPSGRAVSETSYDYSVGSLKKSDVKGNGRTDVKGKSKISCIIPEGEELRMLTIEIRSGKLSGDFSRIIPSVSDKPKVSFFPEGGTLVAGLINNVGLKVLNNNNMPAIVSGVITDEKGNILDSTRTGPSGLGKFSYIPTMDTCFLVITSPEGIPGKFPLPLARESGTIISYIGSQSDTAIFSITSNDTKPQKSFWIGVLNRKMVWNSVVNHSLTGKVAIPLNEMSSGILQVTVFNQDYKIIAERLIHVKRESEKLTVKMERQVYQSRQRVSLLVEYPGKLINSNLAVSVSVSSLADYPDDPDFNAVINSNICDINSGNNLYNNDLDLLTSTQYIIDWHDILMPGTDKEPYTRRDGLNGIVYDKKENVSPHAKVRITHFPNFRLYETQTDENGIFRVIFGTEIIDYKFLNIDAYDASGKTNLNARIDYSYVENLTESFEELENRGKEKISDLDKFGEPDLVYVLRYGPGKFRKSRTESRKKYDPYLYSKYTDIMDIIQDIEPYRLSENKIIFTEKDRNRQDSVSMEEAIIVVNGSLKGSDIGALKNIYPSDITNISISNLLLDVHKYTPLNFNSVIEITTIQGMYKYRQPAVQTGSGILNTEREFYSPDYSVESSYSADNRRTLYWNSDISLYQGNSILVTFYTSDVKGTFYGHITGLDSEGNPVEEEFSFKVE